MTFHPENPVYVRCEQSARGSFPGTRIPGMIAAALIAGSVLSGCTASGNGNFFESVASDVRQERREERRVERRVDRRERTGQAMGAGIDRLASRDTLGERMRGFNEEGQLDDPVPGGESAAYADATDPALRPEQSASNEAGSNASNPNRIAGLETGAMQAASTSTAQPVELSDPDAGRAAPVSTQSGTANRVVIEEDLENGTLLSALPRSEAGNGTTITGASMTGFALGTESPVLADPLEAAAEQRITSLYSTIDHATCDGGWGPKPKKMDAKRITPGDPYYIELRMRKTPLMPVGHTYVAYGKLDAFGQPIDEHLIMLAPVGGYAGAALASGIPMPGVLTPHRDDCRIRPETGYRVSLSAQKYERLLQEIDEAKREKPSYLLFANNCNHFMTRIATSVGLKPPRNIYVPALQYIYDIIEANEGRDYASR